jgi:hypothetical protein
MVSNPDIRCASRMAEPKQNHTVIIRRAVIEVLGHRGVRFHFQQDQTG